MPPKKSKDASKKPPQTPGGYNTRANSKEQQPSSSSSSTNNNDGVLVDKDGFEEVEVGSGSHVLEKVTQVSNYLDTVIKEQNLAKIPRAQPTPSPFEEEFKKIDQSKRELPGDPRPLNKPKTIDGTEFKVPSVSKNTEVEQDGGERVEREKKQKADVNAVEAELFNAKKATSEESSHTSRMPRIYDVVGQTAESVALVDSGLLLKLFEQVADEDLASMGPRRLVTSAGSRILSPYMQLLLAVCGKFYVRFPEAHYDDRVLRLLHYSVGAGSKDPTEAYKYTDVLIANIDINRLRINVLLSVVACILIPGVEQRSHKVEDIPAPTVLNDYLRELESIYPEVVVAYRFVSQFVRGGVDSVSPIPELLQYDRCLAVYLDSACQGSAYLVGSNVQIEERALSLRNISAVTGVSAPVDRMQQMKGMSKPVIPVRSSDVGIPGFNFKGSGSRPAEVTPTARHPLLSQVGKSGAKIERDTTSFQASVMSVDDYIKRIELLESENAEQKAEVLSLKEEVEKIKARQLKTESEFANYIRNNAAKDLQERANLNRTLVTVSAPELHDVIQTAPLLTPMPKTINEELIKKVECYKPNTDCTDLLKEAKNALIAMGDLVNAENIGPFTFRYEFGRKRLILMLKGEPVV